MEKVSLRQVGKEITGKLYRGPIIDAYNRLSQPSIPTRMEQILTMPSRTEGFNCSSHRFISSSSSFRHPGPADYNNSRVSSNPSVSKKGYLITKSSRFSKHQYSTIAPGPGSYSSLKARPSGVTITGRGKALEKSFEVPSPGYYEPKTPASTRETTSMFKSSSKRMPNVVNADLPSPWQYNPNRKKKSNKPNASFVMPSNSRREQINLYDPHAKPVALTTPGPADYSISANSKSRPSSMFLANEIDRFGKAVRKRKREIAPGPGEYSIDKENEKSLVTGAAFVSESKREWIQPRKKPPGPAFYTPTPVPKKKSFHLSTRKIWV